MDKTKNYYRVLGVLPSAEPIVIRAAYRALAAKYHPDKWPGDKASAERRMKEINEAYEILSNDKSRKEYDSVRQKQEFEDYEFENDATQEAFQDAEKAQRSDWDVAIEYYPELNAISADLRKTSTKLAFAFRATVLETKQFSQGKRLAEQLEQSFLRTYFGRNPEIIRFARTLIASGHKAAARELNRAISVLGHGADEEVIIARIQKRFDLAPKDTTSEHTADTASERATDIRSVHETAETLLQTNYVSDAVALVKKLGGAIVYKPANSMFPYRIWVAVLGENRSFKREYDMVQWVIKTIVPKVLSS